MIAYKVSFKLKALGFVKVSKFPTSVYSKSKLELESKFSEVLPVNC